MSVVWERVTRLFDAARALDQPARAAFLDVACGADASLRSEIDALLSAEAVNDSFLAPPPYAGIFDGVQALYAPVAEGLVLKDRYVIEAPFGSGGQANVYRATDRVLSRPVVVKVMRVAGPHNRLLRRRFEHERQALARIDHPAVVGILDVGELEDGSPFLVIQYIEGVSLRVVLENGPVEPARCARIVSAIASALSAAHAANVIHQDLKPENVMVQQREDGEEVVKLIDFGIAKVDRSDLAPSVTTVMVAGTVRYMAPEQFQGIQLPASDVYSLGLLACELLCGHPDVRALPRSTRRSVRRLIEHAVVYRPEDRPPDVSAWATRLSISLRPHRAARAIMVATGIVVLLAGGMKLRFASALAPLEADERVIEKIGAFDPLTEGFLLHGPAFGTVVYNQDHSAFIGWRVSSANSGGGYYYRKLSDAQKRQAISRGWTLSGTLQPQAGNAYLFVDFAGHGPRFDISVEVENEFDIIRLTTQIVPAIQGMEVRLPHSESVYRKYELSFDPGLQTANLWVDGRQVLTGYRGHSQFQDDVGVAFGTGPYKVETGVATFQGLRFALHP